MTTQAFEEAYNAILQSPEQKLLAAKAEAWNNLDDDSMLCPQSFCEKFEALNYKITSLEKQLKEYV